MVSGYPSYPYVSIGINNMPIWPVSGCKDSGDTVEIIDGKVYINGSDTPLDEPYVNGDPIGSFGPYTVPEDGYFMMGDNRNHSADSRFWNQPYVYSDKILGKALLR